MASRSGSEAAQPATGVAPLALDSDDFELFGVPRRFVQDRAALDERWKQLQREAHPDRFAASDAAQRRVAMQWSVRINEAYQRLKDPLKRAVYLCELAGTPVDLQSNTAMPTEFLMQQMQWREALDDATSVAGLQALWDVVQAARQQRLAQVATLLDDAGDAPAAAAQVRSLMFMERFAQDVEARLDETEK